MQFLTRQKKSTHAGFSLIELMVSLTIFSIVMLMSVGTLLVLIDANAKAQAVTNSVTNLSFALDSMTRNIRTGRSFYCTSATLLTGALPTESSIANCTTGNTAIVFTPGTDSTMRIGYRFINGTIEERIDKPGALGTWLAITSDQPPLSVTITNLRFVVDGVVTTATNDAVQPRLSFIIQGTTQNGLETSSPFQIQSRITQRILDY
jgi:prepilin-type N-terminal cleavage/methylation domain-containing protein